FDELLTALGSVATENLGEMLTMLSADDHGLLRLSRRIMRDLDGDLLLVIDQFEELYTLVTNAEIRARFVESLIEAVSDPHSRLRIVITIRADFFDQPLLDDRLGPLVAQTSLAVATPAPDQLLEAVNGPARAAGLELEGGLAERIVEDVRNEPGGLPLMQFTLQALADAALPGWLTHEKYAGVGGVTGALSARADQVFDQVGEPDQAIAERILLRLVSVSEDNDDVRRRIRKSELESLTSDVGAVDRVLDAFGSARLVTFDRDPTTRGPTVEVAHEALLREWDRMRDWVDEQRDDLVTHRRFTAAMDEWRAAGEADEHLPTGGRLAQFKDWFPRAEAWLSEPERAFMRLAVDQREMEQRRRSSRRRRIAASLVAAAVISALMAGIAWVQASLASARELIAEAEIHLEEDPELAIHLGLESAERFDRFGSIPARVTDLLREATAANPVVGRIPHGSATAVSADGSVLVTVDEDEGGPALMWDPVTLAPLGEIEPPGEDPINFVYPQAIGDELFISTLRGDGVQEVWAWSVSQRTFIESLSSDAYLGPLVGWFQVNPSGGLISESTDASLSVRERASGDEVFRTLISSGSEHRFLDDERIAVLADTDAGVRAQIHDLVTGAVLTDFAVEGDVPQPLFIQPSPSGETIIVASQVAIAAYDTNTGAPLWMGNGSGRVFRPLWLPGDRIMVGGEGLAVLLDAATGAIESTLPGFTGGTWSYTQIPDTELIASAAFQAGETLIFDTGSTSNEIPIAEPIAVVEVGDDGWALVKGRQQAAAVDPSGSVAAWFPGSDPAVDAFDTWGFPVMSPSGQHLAYIGPAGESRLWSIADDNDAYEAPDGYSIRGISEDGSEVVISSGGDTQVVDVFGGRTLGKIDPGINVSHAHFSSDERYLITSSGQPPYFRVWSRADYSSLATFGSEDAFEWANVVTPDGQRFITAGADGTLRIYDFNALMTGKSAAEALLDEIDAHNNFTPGLDISGDGRHLVSVSWDEPGRVWDLDSGRLVATVGTVAPAVGFHPTEPLLYVAESGQLDVVELDTAKVLEDARSSLTRDLTAAECERYLRRSCDSGSEARS
ncbi:MAG: WD40 repeat domain-containing protein, partial [Acidimicrobiia bacterium]|nr:WD40 repeat domain-containing protein [Acidimicrobiia bacterium]